MEALSLHELHKICRICLKSDILVSIYSPTFLIRPVEMLDKLKIATFKVNDDTDTLPSLLCQSCLYRLLDAYNLIELAEASERRLRQYFFAIPPHSSLSSLPPDIDLIPVKAEDAVVNNSEYSSLSMSNTSCQQDVCDIMLCRHDVTVATTTTTTNDIVEVVGGDDVELLNDVEIDVSGLTRSEADENTLGDVFGTKMPRVSFDITKRYDDNYSYKMHESYNAETQAPTSMESRKELPRKTKNITMKFLKNAALRTADECLECGKIFQYKGYLEIHKRVHTGERPFKCQICTREFITSTKLLLHQRSTHSTDKSNHKRFQCEICSAFFATSSNLKSHKLTHISDRKYSCKHCNMSFKSKRDLKRHEPMHKTIRDIFCEICGKSFTKHASLNAHLSAVHRRIRKHKCSECDKIFGKKSNLINHMRTHSGEKPFECPSCYWKFAQSSALKRHMKKHNKSSSTFEQTS